MCYVLINSGYFGYVKQRHYKVLTQRDVTFSGNNEPSGGTRSFLLFEEWDCFFSLSLSLSLNDMVIILVT